MKIVLFRIDDRLVHGQVVHGWLDFVGANSILIANDVIASDDMQAMLIKMAVPLKVDVFIETLENAVIKLKNDAFLNKKLLILVSSPKDAYYLFGSGIKVPVINLGGLHYSEGKNQILQTLSIDDEDVLYIKQLHDIGVEVEKKSLPQDEKINIFSKLKELGILK